MSEEVKFIYSVFPKKPIKNILPDNRAISNGKSLELTKEQALECMKYGTIYRRFAVEGRNERVTTANIDRLHNERFMTEEEYKQFTSKGKETGFVVDTTPVVEESVVEEVPVEEEVIEEVADEPTAEEEVEIEFTVEDAAEPVAEEETVTQDEEDKVEVNEEADADEEEVVEEEAPVAEETVTPTISADITYRSHKNQNKKKH